MKDIISILKNVGAIITDSHFVGTQGLHMPVYINKDALLPHTKYVSEVGKLFAQKFKGQNVEVVIAPAVAGIPFSQWTAYHLSEMDGRDVLSVFTEKTSDNDQVFKRGYDAIVRGKRVLVVEDTTTQGSSIKKVIKSVKDAGGNVVAATVMVNRDPKAVTAESIGVPFSPLAVYEVPSYEAENCPLCKANVPMNTQFGHGKKFLEAQKKS
jgi:orotate phosphoribosyltransferase